MRSAAALGLILILALPAAAATDADIDPTAAPPAAIPAEPPAAEPAVVDLLNSFGLFGTFAADCSKPPAPANPHVSVTRQDGGPVIEAHNVGVEYAANFYSVRAARKIGADRLEIKVVFVPGTQAEEFQTLEVKVGDGARRTMFNRVDNGPVRVKRGIAVANGSKTPMLKKCP